MNRRDFIAVATAVPFAGFSFNNPVACHSELLPHRLVMPGVTWPTLAFVGQVTNRFMFVNGMVTHTQGQKLSKAINDEWSELSQWFSLCLGVERDKASEQWLLGADWERRVRVAEAYCRGGTFKIEPQVDGVLLLRTEE